MATPLFSDAMLRAQRARSEANMPERGQRTVPVDTDLGGGNTKTTYQVSGTPLPCRLAPLSEAEALQAGQPTATGMWRLILPTGTMTDPRDRWVVTSDAGWTRTVDVVGAKGPKTFETQRELLVQEAPVAPQPV